MEVTLPLAHLAESHRAALEDLRALVELTSEGAWPTRASPEFVEVMCRLQDSLNAHLDVESRDLLPLLGRQNGLDAATLRRMALDHHELQGWVRALVVARRDDDGDVDPEALHRVGDVVTSLLRVHLRTEELAYLGLLALVMCPEHAQGVEP